MIPFLDVLISSTTDSNVWQHSRHDFVIKYGIFNTDKGKDTSPVNAYMGKYLIMSQNMQEVLPALAKLPYSALCGYIYA